MYFQTIVLLPDPVLLPKPNWYQNTIYVFSLLLRDTPNKWQARFTSL